jgi:hypothetical protein
MQPKLEKKFPKKNDERKFPDACVTMKETATLSLSLKTAFQSFRIKLNISV